MSIAIAQAPTFGLPWELTPADGARLRGWLRICGTIAFLIGVAMPWLPLPEAPPVPTSVTAPAAPIEISLVQPRRITPLPPPPMPAALKESSPAKRDPTPVARAQPRPQATPDPKPGLAPEGSPTVADARAVAASAGLLAASSALGGLRGAVDAQKLASSGARATGVGTAATVDHALLTSHHGTRSAGVNEGSLSQGTGGVALAGRATTRVGVPGGTGAGGGTAAGAGSGSSSIGGTENGTGTGTGQRSIEDIRRVFDANKGAIFAIYHRALREDPSLQGQVVVELVIEPDGAVADIRVVSSELADAALVDRLVSRIRMFEFGARDVGMTRISYPVHFLPG